jgi:hypothetical protein
MTITFDKETPAILDGRNFATVATLNPDGSPQLSSRTARCRRRA